MNKKKITKTKALPKIKVAGLTIQNILKMTPLEINSLNTKDLKSVTSRLVSAANKRIRRLAKSSESDIIPAYQSIVKNRGGKPFSVKGKNINELRNEMKKIHNFLNLKTSTIRGWKSLKKDVSKRLGGDFESNDEAKKFWEVYRKLKETEKGAFLIVKSSEQIQQMLYEVILLTDDEDSIIKKIKKNLDQLYESLIENENMEDGAADVFTIENDL